MVLLLREIMSIDKAYRENAMGQPLRVDTEEKRGAAPIFLPITTGNLHISELYVNRELQEEIFNLSGQICLLRGLRSTTKEKARDGHQGARGHHRGFFR
jgi:hypothetical protein